MPELPEVESIRRKLESALIGRSIVSIKVLLPRIVETHTPIKFARLIVGKRIVRSHRVGKYLFYELDDGQFLHVHLRMTGRLQLSNIEPAYARVKFGLDNATTLWYCDSRTLGKVAIYPGIPESVHSMTDAVNDEYDREFIYKKLKARSASVKDVLLDQKFLAGIGNIYACEICYRAGVSPYRPANRITRKEAEKLYTSIREVMQEAIAAEGTTFSDYRGADGKPGSYQLQLRVYDRAGEPCLHCGSPVVKEMYHGRGTYRCKKCQK